MEVDKNDTFWPQYLGYAAYTGQNTPFVNLSISCHVAGNIDSSAQLALYALSETVGVWVKALAIGIDYEPYFQDVQRHFSTFFVFIPVPAVHSSCARGS